MLTSVKPCEANQRLSARVEKRGQAGTDRGPRFLHREGRGHDAGDRLGLHRVVDGAEQVILAAEVVIEGALGDAGPLDDVVDRGGRIPVFGEQLARDRDQQLTGGLALASPQPLDSHGLQPTY